MNMNMKKNRKRKIDKNLNPEPKMERSIDSVIEMMFRSMEGLENGSVSPFVARSMSMSGAVAITGFKCLIDQKRLVAENILPMVIGDRHTRLLQKTEE